MINIVDVANVTYAAPDLDLMEKFMLDFGLTTVSKNNEALYMRGSGSHHHIHVTKYSEEAAFIGATFEVGAYDDLEYLAEKPGSSPVQESQEPGGGYVVSMHTPDNVEIRAIWGREKAEPLAQREAHLFNSGDDKKRVNSSLRVDKKPCNAMRLGHFVLHVSDHDETVQWFTERFHMLASDYFMPPGETEPAIGSFLRIDRGETLVDHHCLLVLQADKVGVHHCAFEVQDLDSVMTAHDYLVSQGWSLDIGVGRHLIGSQIFDYWKDPFGFRVEHYTDGDVVDHTLKPGIFNGTADQTTQWGMEPSLDFFEST